MPQYWLKFLGGAPKVKRYVTWTPLYDGTNVVGLSAVRDAGEALGPSQPVLDLVASLFGSCPQLLAGSPMHQRLTDGDAAVPGIEYTTLMTKYDELVVPYTSGRLAGADNYVLQDVCPNDLAEDAADRLRPHPGVTR